MNLDNYPLDYDKTRQERAKFWDSYISQSCQPNALTANGMERSDNIPSSSCPSSSSSSVVHDPTRESNATISEPAPGDVTSNCGTIQHGEVDAKTPIAGTSPSTLGQDNLTPPDNVIAQDSLITNNNSGAEDSLTAEENLAEGQEHSRVREGEIGFRFNIYMFSL